MRKWLRGRRTFEPHAVDPDGADQNGHIGSQQPRVGSPFRRHLARPHALDFPRAFTLRSGMQLSEYPYVVVRIGCSKCSRKGSYRLARLADRYGAEAALHSVLTMLSADCKLADRGRPGIDRCGAHLPDLDLQHTGVGLATDVAATVFWATLYEDWLEVQPPRGAADMAARASAVAALAAVVDYTITPKRFTPGWELVLSKPGMAAAYAAMAAGFVAASASRA